MRTFTTSDAALTPYHVDRGKRFVHERFGAHGALIDGTVIAANIERRDRWGHPHCRKCEAEASVRYRRSHPDKRRPPLTEEQRRRRNERTRLRRTTPEGGAKARAREKATRQRRAARRAAA
jgi:hypothetical protein